jgi:hypothetical protein
MSDEIINLDQRIERLEDVLADAAIGEFREIPVEQEDVLASVEMGLNLLLTDLKDEIEKTNKLIKREQILKIFMDYSNFAKQVTEQVKEGKMDIELPPETGITEINEMRKSFEFLITTIRLLISDIDNSE